MCSQCHGPSYSRYQCQLSTLCQHQADSCPAAGGSCPVDNRSGSSSLGGSYPAAEDSYPAENHSGSSSLGGNCPVAGESHPVDNHSAESSLGGSCLDQPWSHSVAGLLYPWQRHYLHERGS